ncbi:hypothetical protein KNV64_gp01 [Staphylococcus phage vB_SauP_EBHT]|uniref:Uncharacterized protein n=1 Tax=Staphylococcus phage Portland TaxID=2650876 RepID=A0A7L8ZJN3_9CAUD|nr:hypothetical protein KNV64_gp01 [Staphylococcus phage vB_SauP_EBHT]QOI69177.1 hypothetical protein EBHT_00001 [Staphylococcus phage Portland]
MENVKSLQSFFLKNGDVGIILGDNLTREIKLFVIEKSSFEQLDHNSEQKKIYYLRSEIIG